MRELTAIGTAAAWVVILGALVLWGMVYRIRRGNSPGSPALSDWAPLAAVGSLVYIWLLSQDVVPAPQTLPGRMVTFTLWAVCLFTWVLLGRYAQVRAWEDHQLAIDLEGYLPYLTELHERAPTPARDSLLRSAHTALARRRGRDAFLFIGRILQAHIDDEYLDEWSHLRDEFLITATKYPFLPTGC